MVISSGREALRLAGGKKNTYAGMTVNERLVVSDLMAVFEKAIDRQDYEKATETLKAVGLDDDNIKAILARLSKET